MAGRKPIYDVDTLNKYIDHYFDNNKVFGQIDATEIATYVQRKFNDEKIRYYHFTRNPLIKQRINDINHVYSVNVEENPKEVMVTFNSDQFLNTFKSNPKLMKVQLRLFSQRYEELNLRVIEYQNKCINLENQLEQLKESNNKLQKKNKNLNNINQQLKKNNIKLKNFKKFDEYINMLSYLKEKGLITKLNKDTLSMLLINSNLNNSNDNITDGHLDYSDSNEFQSNSTSIDTNNIISIHDISKSDIPPQHSDITPQHSVNNAISLMNSRLKKK